MRPCSSLISSQASGTSNLHRKEERLAIHCIVWQFPASPHPCLAQPVLCQTAPMPCHALLLHPGLIKLHICEQALTSGERKSEKDYTRIKDQKETPSFYHALGTRATPMDTKQATYARGGSEQETPVYSFYPYTKKKKGLARTEYVVSSSRVGCGGEWIRWATCASYRPYTEPHSHSAANHSSTSFPAYHA